MFKAICVTTVAGAMLAMSIPTARAAGPDFCRDYAHAAENQVRGGLNNPRCIPGMRGERWSSEFRVHYDWCLGVSREAADRERDIRTDYLRHCR
jgi:hypothetical protein